jgi:tetratricopeptide (TPR) repeat protein
LLALSAGSCALTTWAQSLAAAFWRLDFPCRLGNAVIAYAAYIAQMFYPVGLVAHYPHPGSNLRWQDALLPLALLVSITLAVVWLGRRRRYLMVGWFWYLGMLVPVIGLVQVGAQARADRYTYLTQIGLYIMIAWVPFSLRGRTAWYAALAASGIAALAAVAWLQTSHWKNSLALWAHCVACQPDTNEFAQSGYGVALVDFGRLDEAMEHYAKAFAIDPRFVTPRTNYAGILQQKGRWPEALKMCDEALKIDPDDVQAHLVKAAALNSLGQPEPAIREFRIAIEKDPKYAQSYANLAEVLRQHGRYDEALAECRAALRLDPDLAQAHCTMGNVLAATGDGNGAIEHFQTALRIRPDNPLAHEGLADVLWRQGKFREALEHRKQQVALQPENRVMIVKVVRELIGDPRPEARFGADALEIARRLCEATGYQDVLALEAFAAASAETGDLAQAEATIRRALETPMGRIPHNAAVLQKQLTYYQQHQKPVSPGK